jgi:L-seryl-tRNA(Ser) seleniumtransferase
MQTPHAMHNFKDIPSVDRLLKLDQVIRLEQENGHDLTVSALQQALEEARQAVSQGDELPDPQEMIDRAGEIIRSHLSVSLVPVINASGIIVHTNLGRAPLSEDAILAMQQAAAGYSNLEYDLHAGKRGKRWTHAEALLQQLTGAESGLVVNNNAAAVLLVLSALANRKKVIIPHSQLVEIGGGFRVPDVMKQSGAKLVAIGTTNRVHLHDYEQALQEKPALILNAHHSNFKITGFTTEPQIREIAAISRKAGIPLMYDLGSGALLDTSPFGLAHEPTVQEALQDGADIICFSGDKLLGGPQAGIIVGNKALLDRIKKHPIARAVRADKLCLAGISATLIHYLKGEALEKIPVWRMIAMPLAVIEEKARRWQGTLGTGKITDGFSMVGGGSLPGESLPTRLLALPVPQPNQFLAALRQLNPPVIARIENDAILLDPRTVLPNHEGTLLAGLKPLLDPYRSKPRKMR